MLERIRLVFGIDPRSLALFRVMLGGLILIDLALRSRAMTIFYTDSGVLPRSAWVDITNRFYLSLHAASGELWWQVLLFVVAALAALALLVGYRTRLANIVSLILLGSLMNRNGLVLQGGDQLLVVMCFWGIFLPLGMRFSVDAALKPELRDDPNGPRIASEPYRPYFSVATVAVIFQVLYLYFFTALLKTGGAWRTNFDAAFYALSLQHFATSFGTMLLGAPWLLKAATVYVLFVEFAGPVLVLVAVLWWKHDSFARVFTLTRLTGLALLGSLHFAFILMLHIGLFPFIDFMSLSLLIPGVAWAFLAGRRGPVASRALDQSVTAVPAVAPPPEPTVTLYYDVDCGFCLKMCLILREFLLPAHARVIPAQSVPEIGAILERENSWVVTDPEGRTHVHWEAMRLLFKQRLPWRPVYWLLGVPPLPWLGHHLYRWIAEHRQSVSHVTGLWLPWRKLSVKPTIIGSAIALYAFYIVTAFNVYGLPGLRGKLPEHVERPARYARIDQRWDMFAPYPLTTSSYPIITGLLRNGEHVELLKTTSSADDWAAPDLFYSLYGDYRTRKFLGRVDTSTNNAVRRSYGSYLCRQWNQLDPPEDRDHQLGVVEIWFVKLRTNTRGEPKEETRRMAWRHWCFPEFRSRKVFEKT